MRSRWQLPGPLNAGALTSTLPPSRALYGLYEFGAGTGALAMIECNAAPTTGRQLADWEEQGGRKGMARQPIVRRRLAVAAMLAMVFAGLPALTGHARAAVASTTAIAADEPTALAEAQSSAQPVEALS